MTATRNRHLHAIYVGHWAGNLGDSAVFDVLDRALPPEVHLTMEVEAIGDWRRRPQTTFILPQDEAAIEKAVQDCDAVIIPGTTVVTDLHDGDWPIAWIVRSIAAARAHGKRVHAIGVGVYPTEREARSDRFINGFANAVNDFTVRDAASRDALLAAGVDEKKVVLAADLAWLLDRKSDVGVARAEIHGSTGGRPALAVNVVHEDWLADAAFYASIARDIDAIHDELGTVAVFFCNEIRDGDYYDIAAAQRMLGLMKTPATLYPARWLHPEDMVARLACCEHAVSMRYHFSIFAALAGIPWTGFARGGKNRNLLAEFGRKPVLSMGGNIEGGLAREVLSAHRDRTTMALTQSRIVTTLQQRAKLGLDHLRRIAVGPTE